MEATLGASFLQRRLETWKRRSWTPILAFSPRTGLARGSLHLLLPSPICLRTWSKTCPLPSPAEGCTLGKWAFNGPFTCSSAPVGLPASVLASFPSWTLCVCLEKTFWETARKMTSPPSSRVITARLEPLCGSRLGAASCPEG